MFLKLRDLGPGVLVAAAFIGPGTVTASTLAGANFGYALLWALVFATLATAVLQEMSARLGTIAQKGLGEVLVEQLGASMLKWPLFALVGFALYAGNAAYEAGNLAGAALGIEAIAGTSPFVFRASILVLALLSGFVLIRGSYRQIEKVLIGLVLLMGVAFVITFFVVQPSLLSMLGGIFKPTLPDASLITVIALIGTTVVPYNLFLHAAASKNRWSGQKDLSVARTDTILSIGLGGLITILIVSTAAASMFANGLRVNSAADMAVQFEPLFGPYSKYLLGVGLFAAGLSSSITAPLATSYAMSEIFSLKGRSRTIAFKVTSISILVIGAGLSMTGIKPINIIVLAQFANGLLLPIIAGFLLYAMNSQRHLGRYTNGILANILGCAVVLLTFGLGLRLILSALKLI